MPDLRTNIALAFVGPGNVAQQQTLKVTVPFAGVQLGTIDLPVGSGGEGPQVFGVSFGSIGKATGFYLINKTGTEIGIRLNGASSDEFQLTDGGAILIAMPTVSSGNELNTVDIATTAELTEAGTVDFMVFGDPPEPP